MTPFAIFFLRQFFLGINREIEEAATIDGAGHFRIFLQIVLPMSSAPMATLAILTYIGAWNEYFWPLLVASDDKRAGPHGRARRLPVPDPQGAPDWPGLMAATLLAALPIIILFCHLRPKSSTPSSSPASSKPLHRVNCAPSTHPERQHQTMKRRLGLLAPRTGLPLAMTACGSSDDSADPAAAPPAAAPARSATGCGTPTSCRPTRSARTRSTRRTPVITVKIDPVRLGRLLDQAHHRLRLRHRAGRVHRPPVRSTRSSPSKDQLLPLDDLVKQDNVDADIYQPRAWPTSVDRPRRQALRPAEGLRHHRHSSTTRTWPTPPASPRSSWTPWTGTRPTAAPIEKAIANLTVDANGVRGDQPGFDKNNVKTYGLGLEGSGGALRPDPVEHVHRQQRLDRTPTRTRGAPSTTTTTPSSRRPSPGGGR